MKKIYVCQTCGSARVYMDAFVNMNDDTDVLTFDDLHCEPCEKSTHVDEVEVSDDFDIAEDTYKDPNPQHQALQSIAEKQESM